MRERPLKRVDSEVRGGDGGAPVRRPWGIIAHLVFWSWNGLLATIALFGLLPVLGFAFVRDSVDGTLFARPDRHGALSADERYKV